MIHRRRWTRTERIQRQSTPTARKADSWKRKGRRHRTRGKHRGHSYQTKRPDSYVQSPEGKKAIRALVKQTVAQTLAVHKKAITPPARKADSWKGKGRRHRTRGKRRGQTKRPDSYVHSPKGKKEIRAYISKLSKQKVAQAFRKSKTASLDPKMPASKDAKLRRAFEMRIAAEKAEAATSAG